MDNTEKKCIIEAAGMTICGPNRKENQDAIVVNGKLTQRPFLLSDTQQSQHIPISYAVIDGMGGYDGGSDAACIAATSISKHNLYDENNESDQLFFKDLSNKILKAGIAWETPKMGAATSMLTISNGKFIIANIGDCRIYRYDDADEFMTQMSIDDRLKNGNGGITQSLGFKDENLDIHWFSDNLYECEKFLLCSDGVWGTLEEDLLCDTIASYSNVNDTIVNLMQLCVQKNASDNCSAILVKIEYL